MSNDVYQLTQLSCNVCGMGGIAPRTESYHDRFSGETITEATWTCHRCGTRFNTGVVSPVKDNETEE